MDYLNPLREDQAEELIDEVKLANTQLYFAGETAKQADTRHVNDRDTVVIVTLITLLITILLGFQSRSWIAPIYMMATIILSYFAAMGFSIFVFDTFFVYDVLCYRVSV